MAQQTPYEQIRFINDAIKDRQEKNQATFFSVKLERFGALTPLAVKENGANFYETIIQYLTRYDMTALVVELFNGKSHNVKEPFQTFKIVVKRSAEVNGLCDEPELKISPAENVITTEKHFFTMAEKERQVMMLEFDLKRLQYENEELKKKNKKKKHYIEELEAELGKTEKAKKQSFGNVSLGLVGANALEGFAKSSFGLGILKNVFGMKEDTLNGLLGIEEAASPANTASETKSTASIITKQEEAVKEPQTKEEKYRAEIKKFINQFLDSCDDKTLRLYYELIQYLGADTETIDSVLKQLKTYRERQQATIKERMNAPKGNSIKGTNESPDDSDLNDSS